jgi:cell division septation protein DedD
MRWLVLLLLALNLGYLAWELNRPVEQAAHTTRSQDADTPTIVLLSETRSAPTQATLVKSGTADTPVQNAGATTALATSAVPARKAVDTPAPPPSTPAPEPAAAPPPARIISAHVADACYTLGPFRELDKLRKITRDIRDFVVDASFRSHEEREQSMYWVYLPRQPSRAAATALGKQLERKKIRDYYVINSGAQKYGISLGHFKEKERAHDLLGRVTKAGFEPVLEPVFKTYTIYWLDYRVQADGNIPENALDLRAMPNVSRIDRDCG